jgi:translation initiation factor IF-1
MARETPIVGTGIVLTQAGERVYHAALPNGKRVLAHVPRHLVQEIGPLDSGCQVRLELTPYDFSTARIAGIITPGESAAEGR